MSQLINVAIFIVPIFVSLLPIYCENDNGNNINQEHLEQSDNNNNNNNKVLFFTNKNIDKIYVPVAKYPLLSWIELQDGKYPNSREIKNEVQIGQPISIVVYVKDRSQLYDANVNNCIAYNGMNKDDRRSVRIYPGIPGNTDLHNGKMLTWSKQTDNNGNIEMFSTFPAFKFPDRKTLNITCTITICYNKCH